MNGKRFFLPAESIRPVATGHGACIATDRITVDGLPVRFMYREPPSHDADSGWRFTSGIESDEYMDDPANHGIYDVNTIANCDPSIVPHLAAPAGSAFEKLPDAQDFIEVDDWDAESG